MKKHWPKNRLCEIAEIKAGFAWKSTYFSENPKAGPAIVRIQNLGSNDNATFVYYNGEIEPGYWVDEGDLLISLSGSFKVCQWKGPRALLNQRIVVIRPSSKLDCNFAFFQIYERLEEISKSAVGIAVANASMGTVRDMEIAVPPLAEQERIVKILDEADELRKLRAQADRRTTDLIPALFHEMFGDPATNPKGWKKAILGDVIYGAKDGPHVSPKYSEIGVPFLSTRHVKPGRVIWEDLKFISSGDAEYHWKKCKPEKGDILYTKGGTTGIAATINFETPIAIWVHIALLKTNHSKVDSIWLENMLNDRFCYQQSQKFTHGITNKDLGLTRMVNIKMYLPPLPLQHEFAQRVTEIRDIEAEQAKSKSHLDALFHSLLHRAFEGEL